jgi:hypothetical protein
MLTKLKTILKEISSTSIIKRMLIGFGIGLIVISFLVFSVDTPKPEWGTWWQVRPLIITPLAAAFGILAFYLKDIVRPQGNVMNVLVFLVSVLGFIIALWLGIVLGLDGTLWN